MKYSSSHTESALLLRLFLLVTCFCHKHRRANVSMIWRETRIILLNGFSLLGDVAFLKSYSSFWFGFLQCLRSLQSSSVALGRHQQLQNIPVEQKRSILLYFHTCSFHMMWHLLRPMINWWLIFWHTVYKVHSNIWGK